MRLPVRSGLENPGGGADMRAVRRLRIGAVLAVALAALAASIEVSSAQSRTWTFSIWKEGEQVCTAGRAVGIEWRAGQGLADARIDGEELEGTAGVALVKCGGLRADWRSWAARYGTIPAQAVTGRATAADGWEFEEQVQLRILPALSPRIAAVAGDVQAGTLLAAIDPAAAARAGVEQPWVAVRWREIGTGQWSVDAGRHVPLDGDLKGARIRAWLAAGEYEVQAAVLRSPAEVQQPDWIEWSEPPARMTVEPPLDIAAEATHDSITVLLPDGAGLDEAWYELYGPGASHAVDSPARDRVTWTGLAADERYTILAQRVRGGVRGALVALHVRTEPAPPDREGAPDSWGIASAETFPDRIEVAWRAPAGAEDSPYQIYVSEWGAGGLGFAGEAFAQWLLAVGLGDAIARGWHPPPASRRIKVPAGAEHRVEIDGLRPGSTYVVDIVKWMADRTRPGSRLVLETSESDLAGSLLPPPPPPTTSYSAWPAHPCEGGEDAWFTASADESGDWDAVEYEWEVDGRRARRVVDGSGSLHLSQSRRGEYLLRVRGRRGDAWSAWSGQARAGPRPVLPAVSTGVRTAEGVRLTWSEGFSDLAPPADWNLVRWSLDDGEPREQIVPDGREFIVPVAAEWEGRLRATVTGVHRDYGPGEPSRQFEMDVSRSPLEVYVSAGSCRPLAGWRGYMVVIPRGGVAPYAVRAAGVEKAFLRDGWSDLEFDCGAVADGGRVDWQVIDAAGTVRSGAAPLEVIGFSAGGARQAPPAWASAESGRTAIRAVWRCLDSTREEGFSSYSDLAPYVVRWREAGEGAWRYQPGRTSSLEWGYQPGRTSSHGWLCWTELADLRPGRDYEIEVAGYREQSAMPHPDLLRWSAPLTVRTVGWQPEPQVSWDGGELVVSWSRRSDAGRYLVTVRGEGRGWWRLVHASGGELETARFAAPSSGEYEVEIVPAPRIWGEFWPAIRPHPRLGASGPC